MTQQVEVCYRNILETGTVAVTSENASFPAYRLYDRDIGKLFKGNSTPANFYITIDQGAVTSYEIDRLLIPAGHNLTGLAIKVQYSTDNFSGDTNDAASWTQSGSGLIDKSFTAQTKRYWRLNIAAPGSAPELAEMFLTKQYTFQRNPNYGLREKPYQKNIVRNETKSGRVRKIKNGEPRRSRAYALTRITAAQRADLESWESVLDSIKNFYIEDVNGTLFFAELIDDLEFSMEHEGRFGVSMNILEVL